MIIAVLFNLEGFRAFKYL